MKGARQKDETVMGRDGETARRGRGEEDRRQLAAVFLYPLWALGKWWGEPGIETQEVGGEASPGQIQGKENADTIGKDIGVGECTIPSHALKKFQAHAHYKEPNAQPQLRGPLRIDVSKPQHKGEVNNDVGEFVALLEFQRLRRHGPQR